MKSRIHIRTTDQELADRCLAAAKARMPLNEMMSTTDGQRQVSGLPLQVNPVSSAEDWARWEITFREVPSSHSCGSCARGFTKTDGKVACGAPVDDCALAGDEGVNPIWAERKYGRPRILAMLAGMKSGLEPKGADCDDMAFDDGAKCKMWREKAR